MKRVLIILVLAGCHSHPDLTIDDLTWPSSGPLAEEARKNGIDPHRAPYLPPIDDLVDRRFPDLGLVKLNEGDPPRITTRLPDRYAAIMWRVDDEVQVFAYPENLWWRALKEPVPACLISWEVFRKRDSIWERVDRDALYERYLQQQAAINFQRSWMMPDPLTIYDF